MPDSRFLGEQLITEVRLARWENRYRLAVLGVLDALRERTEADLRALVAASWWDDPNGEPFLDQLLTAEIAPVAASIVGEVRATMLDAIPDAYDVYVPPDFEHQARRLYDRVGDMTRQMAGEVAAELRVGVAAGEGIPKLADRVAQTFASSDTRATRIARTEVISATNGASDETAGILHANGLTMNKRWLSTRDGRTRETHAEAMGQTVAYDQMFVVGGAELAYPGDPMGPPDEVINCRCTSVYEEA